MGSFGKAPEAWREAQYGFSGELTLAVAQRMLAAGATEAGRQQCPMSMSVCDIGGNLIAFHRMDNAMIASVQISMDKAYTAVLGKMPTGSLGWPFRTGELIPLHFHERWVTFNGGYPLLREGKIIGGLGVSGGVAEDLYVAREMLKAGGFDTAGVDQTISDYEAGKEV